MDTRHTIEEFVFELNFDDLAPANEFEAGLHEWLRQELLPPFEALFDSLSGPGEMLRIESLEIDLGDLPYENLRQELPTRLLEKLKAALLQYGSAQQTALGPVDGVVQPDSASQQGRARHADVQELLAFLAHGRLPWQASADRLAAHERLLERVAQHDAAALLARIAGSPERATMTERLVRQFPVARLAMLVERIAPAYGKLIAEHASWIPKEAAPSFWRAVFRVLQGRLPETPTALIASMAMHLDDGAARTAWRTQAAVALRQVSKAEERHVLESVLQALSEGAATSFANTAEAIRLEPIWQALREKRAPLHELDLPLADMLRLIEFAILHDAAAGTGNGQAFLRAIEAHATQAVHKRKFFLLVLQSLRDGQLADLEAFVRESADLGTSSPPERGISSSAQESALPVVAGASGTTYRAGNAAPASKPPPEGDGPLRFRLAHCLLNGDVAQLESIWHLLYRQHAALTREALLHYGKFERVRRRFALEYPDAILRDFIELLEPRALGLVMFFVGRTAALVPEAPNEGKRSVWDAAFGFLLSDEAAGFSQQGLAQSLLQEVAAQSKIQVVTGVSRASWHKLLRDAPPALQLALWHTSLADREQSAGNALGKEVLLVKLLQNLKRHRKDDGDSPALLSALDLVFTSHSHLLPALLEAYRRGDIPALPLLLDRATLRRLLLAWIGLAAAWGASGVRVKSEDIGPGQDDLIALVDTIDTHAGQSADPAAYLRAVLARLRQGLLIDPDNPVLVENAMVQPTDKAAARAGRKRTGTSSKRAHAVPEADVQTGFTEAGIRQHANVGNAASADTSDLLKLLHEAGGVQALSASALQGLRHASPESLARLGNAILASLIDRYLEAVAQADTGNRRLFLDAVTDAARQTAHQARFMAVVLIRLIHNETVDFDEIATLISDTNAWGATSPVLLQSTSRSLDDSKTVSQSPQGNATVRALEAPAASLAELRATLSQEIARKTPDGARRTAFLHAIEHHAQLASDRRRFYGLVQHALANDETVDLEAFVERASASATLQPTSSQIAVGETAASVTQDDWEASHGTPIALQQTSIEQWRDSLMQAVAQRIPDSEHRATFIGSVEHHAQLAVDKAHFYSLVTDAIARDEAVDLEAYVQQAAALRDVAPAQSGNTTGMPAALREALQHGNAKRAEAALREAFARQPQAIGQIQAWLADDDAGRRLLALLSPAAMGRVLPLLLGQRYAEIDRLAELAVDAVAFVSGRIPKQAAAKLKQRVMLEQLLMPRADFALRPFLESATALLAQEAGVEDLALIHELIAEHFTAEHSVLQQGDAHAVGKKAGSAAASAASSPSDAPASNVDVHVENAGLVLAWPYLPNLFTRLNLMEKNTFVDAKAAERAVHLLQFMVTGETRTPEYALVLNKQLCGVPTGTPIIGGIDITDTERDTIEGLLQAMIDHWKILGKTSVNGFRESFLQRQGWLTLAEDVWHLRVQTRAYDMLLDQLPWGISMIKHLWMPRPIHVKWR